MKNALVYRTIAKDPRIPSVGAVDKVRQSTSHSSNASPQAGSSGSKSTIEIVRPEKNRNSPRRALLNSLVDQLIIAPTSLKIPRGTDPEILNEVAAAGGLFPWLSMQPDYEALKKSKQKKAISRANKKKLLKNARSQSGVGGTKVTSKDRKQHLQKLVQQVVIDAIIQRQEIPAISIPIGLNEEILASGGPREWVRSQPDYILVLHGRHRSIKQKSPKIRPRTLNAADLPSEDSTTFTTEMLLKRGKSRLIIPETFRPPAGLKELQIIVGTLPNSPRLAPRSNTADRRQVLKICADWVSLMDIVQKEAWKRLGVELQLQYLLSGQISAGLPETSNNGEVSLILDRVKRQGDDQWDVKKIDWGST